MPDNTLSTQGSPERACEECSLCCTVLRVDELRKQGGTPCEHQAPEGGCRIHETRPDICRAYRCLWLKGGSHDQDRPDRLGAVIDLLSEGATTRVSIQEARAGAFDASARLQEIADLYRDHIPVRVVAAGNWLSADRPFRVLLANAEEQHVRGDVIEIYRDGELIERKRMPWLERQARRIAILMRSRRVRRNEPRKQEPSQ